MPGDFRTFLGQPPSVRPLRAHDKNPTLIRPTAGSRNQAADVAQLAEAKQRLFDEQISQHDARLRYMNLNRDLRNLPIQLSFTPFIAPLQGMATNSTNLVVPRNINRFGLIVSYQEVPPNTGGVAYSFGPPLATNNAAAGLSGIFFNPQLPMTHFYIAQACPIDDVWVVVQAANGGVMIFYEGTVALDANL